LQNQFHEEKKSGNGTLKRGLADTKQERGVPKLQTHQKLEVNSKKEGPERFLEKASKKKKGGERLYLYQLQTARLITLLLQRGRIPFRGGRILKHFWGETSMEEASGARRRGPQYQTWQEDGKKVLLEDILGKRGVYPSSQITKR